MDIRLTRLEVIRERKAELAHAEFQRAYRHFAAAHRHHEALVQQRAAGAERSDLLTRQELGRLSHGAVTTSAIAAVHDAAERRKAALALLDEEIARALAERERLRQIAQEKRQVFLTARRVAEKLGLLVDKLRDEEISLQSRLSESRADSVVKDAATGRWMPLQTDS
ncbi:MAG TPA: hypothetical protein PK812_05295 [Beijerinckiaceae bacterium]|nr:hypothetical protein [Beijerinckiaceae bacterium]